MVDSEKKYWLLNPVDESSALGELGSSIPRAKRGDCVAEIPVGWRLVRYPRSDSHLGKAYAFSRLLSFNTQFPMIIAGALGAQAVTLCESVRKDQNLRLPIYPNLYEYWTELVGSSSDRKLRLQVINELLEPGLGSVVSVRTTEYTRMFEDRIRSYGKNPDDVQSLSLDGDEMEERYNEEGEEVENYDEELEPAYEELLQPKLSMVETNDLNLLEASKGQVPVVYAGLVTPESIRDTVRRIEEISPTLPLFSGVSFQSNIVECSAMYGALESLRFTTSLAMQSKCNAVEIETLLKKRCAELGLNYHDVLENYLPIAIEVLHGFLNCRNSPPYKQMASGGLKYLDQLLFISSALCLAASFYTFSIGGLCFDYGPTCVFRLLVVLGNDDSAMCDAAAEKYLKRTFNNSTATRTPRFLSLVLRNSVPNLYAQVSHKANELQIIALHSKSKQIERAMLDGDYTEAVRLIRRVIKIMSGIENVTNLIWKRLQYGILTPMASTEFCKRLAEDVPSSVLELLLGSSDSVERLQRMYLGCTDTASIELATKWLAPESIWVRSDDTKRFTDGIGSWV